jgi:hypothetical protein
LQIINLTMDLFDYREFAWITMTQAVNIPVPVMSAPIASELFTTRGPWPAEEMKKYIATPGHLDNTRAALGAVTGELRGGVIMTVDRDGDIMGSCLALHDSLMWRVGYKASQVRKFPSRRFPL